MASVAGMHIGILIFPAVTQLDTWNAESNSHMIAINEQLNYHIVARSLAFQKSL